MHNYLYDDHFVRYNLVKTSSGSPFNWIFVPGGPGADSRYFHTLTNHLDLPGNSWLIDFPANGDNLSNTIPADYDFEKWADCLLSVVTRFPNPIYVGHSFGGMFPLLFPQLEDLLKGFIILNATPARWLDEAAKLAHENNIPILTEPMQAFENNPNQDTFKEALLACLPYYFPSSTLELGTSLLKDLPCNYHAAVWWLKKVNEINFNAKWIPQNIPTLIIGASHDFVTPFSLFKKDQRFKKDNIQFEYIQDAGHFPWIEKIKLVTNAFSTFVDQITDPVFTKLKELT